MRHHKNSSSSTESLRHSLAHLLAAAVAELYPDAKPTFGPAIENGFYYDFDFSQPLSEEELPAIEDKMREILHDWTKFEEISETTESARERYGNNHYKLELIDEIVAKGENLTSYKSGNFIDLCRGGHVEDAQIIDPESFKLDRLAGAYWRGDEHNKMLTRIYGLAFATKQELDDYLVQREEAKKRDHKKLGQELDLFYFSDTVGKGLPLFTPKGSVIRRELERFILDEELKRGYLHVYTPDIAKLDLYKKSGHYPHYKDSMYAPLVIDEEEFMLRPMTCPHHFELYLRTKHSYRELPMRIAELAKLYRYEQSGELAGLQRVRTFCLADAHIICASEQQAAEEISGALDLIEYTVSVFGLTQGKEYWYRLSLGDRSNAEKYYQNDQAWDTGEDLLRKLLKQRSCQYVEAPGEAAFYGPKIDIQMRNINGKEDTAFTVQYDFCMPGRFKLAFTDKHGEEKQALVVHRSSIGAIERSMAFLIEHYAGAFPVWLSPVQVAVLLISDKVIDYSRKVIEELKASNIRYELDDRNESIGKKIREAELQKIPYLLVIGEKEASAEAISVRKRGSGDTGQLPLDEFLRKTREEIEKKI